MRSKSRCWEAAGWAVQSGTEASAQGARTPARLVCTALLGPGSPATAHIGFPRADAAIHQPLGWWPGLCTRSSLIPVPAGGGDNGNLTSGPSRW